MPQRNLNHWLSEKSPLAEAWVEIEKSGLDPEYIFAKWLDAIIKEREAAAEREEFKELCADERYDKGFGDGFREGQKHVARPQASPAPLPSPPEPAPPSEAPLNFPPEPEAPYADCSPPPKNRPPF